MALGNGLAFGVGIFFFGALGVCFVEILGFGARDRSVGFFFIPEMSLGIED